MTTSVRKTSLEDVFAKSFPTFSVIEKYQ